MKDKGKTSHKKSAVSKSARSAKRTGPVTGSRRTSAPIEDRFRAVFESSRDAIGVSKAGIHVFVNPAYLELFGFPRGTDLAGKPVLDLIAPESRDQIREYIHRRERGEEAPSTYETRGFRADGSAFDMEVNVSPYQENEENHTLVILRDITRRKMTEEEISERGAMLQQIMDTASVAIGLLDKTGRFTLANRRTAEMFGRTLEELVGSKYIDHVHPNEREAGRKSMLALLESEIPSVDLERLYQRKDGTQFWGHLACRRFYDVHGKELGLIGVITDITERKQAEEALKNSEGRLNTILDNAGACIFIKDTQYRYTYVNRKVSELIGRRVEEILGKSDKEFLAAESAEEVIQSDRPVIERGETVAREEAGLISSDKVPRTYWTVKLPLRDSNGTVTGLCGISTDITLLKNAEAALIESENRTRSIIELLPIGMHMYRLGPDGRLVFTGANPAADKILGVDNSIFIGKTIEEAFPPLKATEAPRRYREAAASGKSWHTEQIEYHEGGISGAFEVYAFQTAPNTMAAAFEDITERKRAEEALRENQARLDLALQSAHMGVWRWEIKENRRSFDDLTCQLIGIDATTFSGTEEEFFRAVHPEDREKIKAALSRTIEQDALYEPTYRVVWRDRSIHDIAARGRLVRDNKGQPARINGILWDITDQRHLEDERLKTQKLESIGTLAGGIAHDFNNLLQGVFGYISMAKLTYDQKDKSFAMLEQAEKALHQSVNLTSQLLTFSKGGKPVKKVLALRPVIENSVAFALSGSHNTSEIVIDDNLRAVEADEGQLRQVIQNIVLNADQAMPLGGMIRVSIRNMPAAAIVPQEGLQGDLVEISIQDQGAGIPPEHLTRIFDPYFTTKEKGSGLGLATSYSIIRNHGGLVRVQSEVGKGTIFLIYLPASGSAVEEIISPAIPAATRKGRILVMDDEEIIRAVAGEILTFLGHEVAFAESGEGALDAYRAAQDAGRPFDVVILDLTIQGGMGGMEALQKLMEIDPEVKAVVSSGYSDDAAMSDYRKQGFKAFLKKPYHMVNIQNILNALLA